MKRNLLILLVVVLAAVGGFIYLRGGEGAFSKETSLYKAIPQSVPVFYEIDALKSLPLENPIVRELMANPGAAQIASRVSQIDSTIGSNKEIQNSLRSEPFAVAFDFVGEASFFPILIMKAESATRKKSLQKLVGAICPTNGYIYNEIEYSGYKIQTLRSKATQKLFCYSFADGLFLASSKILLVEQSLRQLSAKSIASNSNFSKVNKTVSSQSKISLFINHQAFPGIVAVWLNANSTVSENEFGDRMIGNPARAMKFFGNYAAWSELDVSINEHAITMNGVSTANDSLHHFLSVFEGQQPLRFQAPDVLPANTSFFTSYTFSNKKLFFERLEKHFSHTGNYYKREDRIKKMEALFRTDLKAALHGLAKNEIVVASTNIPADPANKTTLFLLQTTGKKSTETAINSWIESYAQQKGVGSATLKKQFSLNKETSFTIYQFPFPSLPGIWLGKPFGLAETRFAAIYGDFLVFCNSENGLNDYLYNMELGTTLGEDTRFANFKNNIDNKANIDVYLNVNRVLGLKNEIFNAKTNKVLDENEEYLRKFEAINWQVINEKGIFFNSVYTTFYQERPEEAQTTWQSNIDGKIASKPQIVIDHNNPENREVVSSDDKHNFFLLSKDGLLRWKVKLDGPILSEIHQVDYFRNGKLQYLFNTKNKLYLIDREGKNVAHFPVDFATPASNGINVFDYDNNRKYRYFVAFENNKVVALDSDGKEVSGWMFTKTGGTVTAPVQHFRVGNKDYIVFADNERIYILDRRGETRVKSKAVFSPSGNAPILNMQRTPKIVSTDRSGHVYYLFFDGTFKTFDVGGFSASHFFDVSDLDGDGSLDFVFADGKKLMAINETGKTLYSEKFKNEISIPPAIYDFGAKLKKVGVVDPNANRIYLFNPDGNLHDGFPLQGNTGFSIGELARNSGRLNLIVGSKNGNLYNYTLN